MALNDRQRWRFISQRNFTKEQLAKANENYAKMRERFPKEAAYFDYMMDERGLGEHPSIVNHFLETFAPPPRQALGTLLMYPHSTGVTHGRDEVLEPAKSGSAADAIYRKAQ